MNKNAKLAVTTTKIIPETKEKIKVEKKITIDISGRKNNFKLSKNNKSVIIFDLDGTILDSINMFNEIYSKLLKNITNKTISTEQIQDDWDDFRKNSNEEGNIVDNFLLYLDKKYSLEAHDIQDLRKKYQEISYSYQITELQYKKYAGKVLKELKRQGYTLVLATLSTKDEIDIYNDKSKKLYKEFKIYDIFNLVLTNEDVKEKKPNPEIYLEVIKRLNVSKEDCLIIEDSIQGIQAANAAGIEVVNIEEKGSYKYQKLIDELCDYKFNSLKDLYETILISDILPE